MPKKKYSIPIQYLFNTYSILIQYLFMCSRNKIENNSIKDKYKR